MNLQINPADALAYIESANAHGVAHSFVQHANPVTDELTLGWEPSEPSPQLLVLLKNDGTWRAAFEMPGVGEQP